MVALDPHPPAALPTTETTAAMSGPLNPTRGTPNLLSDGGM
jgi:hypothetical protein